MQHRLQERAHALRLPAPVPVARGAAHHGPAYRLGTPEELHLKPAAEGLPGQLLLGLMLCDFLVLRGVSLRSGPVAMALGDAGRIYRLFPYLHTR